MEKVSIVSPGQAVASLRESDFDTCSAVGEVIDNALQADADNVRIAAIEETLPARGRRPAGAKRIIEIAFGDDGHGMDRETLHRCLQLGYSTRYNDRTGIGRFGVGMTLGAINQCDHIEVYSKTKADKEWLFTQIDLDAAETDPHIPEPQHRSLPNDYKALVGSKHGTLVVWKKCLRLTGTREEIEHWIARSYRKFLGEKIVQGGTVVKNPRRIRIKINGDEINAFDPLYAIRNSEFPKGPEAVLYDEIVLDVDVPSDANVLEKASRITIQMSLLPEHWRTEAGSGGSELAKKLRVTENEGFSILRANREVFYDEMPHFDPRVDKDGFDRWWSAEISFAPALDKLFSVRNIKRGARLLPELREEVQKRMRPTILEARRVVHAIYDAAKAKSTHNGRNVSTEHTEAETTVRSVNPPPGKSGTDKSETEKKKEIEQIIKPLVHTNDELAAWTAKIESQPCTIIDQEGTSWKGDTFLDVHPQGGSTIIEYNMGHDFFVLVYGAIKELAAEAEPKDPAAVESVKKLKAAIDLLFMAYAQAEAQFDPAHTQAVGDTLSLLRNNWGAFLRQFVRRHGKIQ